MTDQPAAKPIVLVTGGSRGIGKALAARFAKAGHDVAIVARDPDHLSAAAKSIEAATGVCPLTLACDLTAPDAPKVIKKELMAAGFYIDILINNAALGLSGPFAAHSADEIDRLLALNISAIVRMTHAGLNDMIARRHGGILNIASLGGYAPGPGQAIYYASKAFVLSLTEALAVETSGLGIRIAAVAPGPVATTFHKDMHADDARYRLFLPELSPDRVARITYCRFMLGQRVIVPGLVPQIMQAGLKVLPHRMSAAMIGWLLHSSKERR